MCGAACAARERERKNITLIMFRTVALAASLGWASACSKEEYRAKFGAESVGLLTGDASINAEAPCLILTTEILRGLIQRGAPAVTLAWKIAPTAHADATAESRFPSSKP